MSIQYVTDDAGNKLAVLIPVEEWKAIQDRLAERSAGRPVEVFGLTVLEAKETRARLEALASDWDSLEMDAYDHYDEAKAPHERR
ncbi:hypothetical protein [Fundidesulfovibrio agrisoli]|uniref:hypothetical protein n=1 Tax=Fundidesulfovibrio agrisoli TaxID=2922717 RepID=UPI001FAE3CFB|nr:hypothetical protein [Fundidesulfovibrio agrisoli]